MAHRVNVIFSDDDYATLERLAKRRNKSMSLILRDALQLEEWVDDARSDGGHLMIERKGKVQEIIPR